MYSHTVHVHVMYPLWFVLEYIASTHYQNDIMLMMMMCVCVCVCVRVCVCVCRGDDHREKALVAGSCGEKHLP